MTVAGLLRDNPHPDREEIVEGISGNLCRCIGYRNIVASVERAAELLRDGGTEPVARSDDGEMPSHHPPPEIAATAPFAPTGDSVPGKAAGAGERQRAGGRGPK
jgi:hypothetical protein